MTPRIGTGISVYRKRGGGGVSATPVTLVLTSVGSGVGVARLRMTSSADTLLTLDGTARFYSDSGGTADESTTWTVTSGAQRERYIKCPSSTANFTVADNTITSWGGWSSGANAPSLSGNIGQMTALTYLHIDGNNTISGDISDLPSLTYIHLRGSNTLQGSVAALTSLTNLRIEGNTTVSGSIAALTSLSYVRMRGSNAISGSLDALTSLTYLFIEGSNVVSGDISLISAGITRVWIEGDSQIVDYTSGADWSSILNGGDVYVITGVGYGLSSAEVDLLIQEVESTRTAGRAIDIVLTGSNAARTSTSDAAVADIIADGGTVTTNP